MISAYRKGDEIVVTGADNWSKAEEAACEFLAPNEDLNAENAKINLGTDARHFYPDRRRR